jgi:hypothetical protein
MIDLLEQSMTGGAVRALRKRAAAQREKAALGITPGVEKYPEVLVIASEAAAALRIAADLAAIANEIGGDL